MACVASLAPPPASRLRMPPRPRCSSLASQTAPNGSGDPNARDQYQGQPAYELAERFADEWDQAAFDPDYDTLPLEHFEPRLRELFANPKSL